MDGETARRWVISQATVLPRTVDVLWGDGHQSQFHHVWLRDNCQNWKSRAEGTTQRLVDSDEIPADIAPQEVTVSDDGTLRVAWANDRHCSVYEPQWLREHCYSTTAREARRRQPNLWDGRIAEDPPVYSWEAIDDDIGRFGWLATLVDMGFVLLRGVPTTMDEFERIAGEMGYIRHTNYGRVFDVVSQANLRNLAYSDRALSVHTDNPYRAPIPGIQLLHCVQASAEGGETMLLDGFRVTADLRRTNHPAFELLSTVPRHFRFADEHSDLRNDATIIQLDANRDVVGVRFNSRSASTLSIAAELVEPYYDAYRTFAAMLNDTRYQYQIKLQPGDLLTIDNERVLHGRKAFDARQNGRHLRGAYVDRDEICSRLRKLGERLGIRAGDPASPGGPRLHQ